MYKYELEKQRIFTEDGQETFLKIRDKVHKLLNQSGSVDSARFDLSSEGLDRECEMARRRVMAHVHNFIYSKAKIVFLDSVVGNTASPLEIVRFYRQTGVMFIPPAPYLG